MVGQRNPNVFAMDWKAHHQASSKNLSDYGNVVPVFKNGRLTIWKLQREIEAVVDLFQRKDFDCGRDFIAVLGSPVNASVVFMAVASMMPAVHQVNVLYFDSTKQQYRLQVVQL